jgi:hypothetical protein
MPLVKFSALVTGMNGKANGSVFATNNSGAYFRTNPGKLKPKTPRNSVRKASFTSVSQAWRALSIDEQEAWDAVTSNYIRPNAFGDPVEPSGYTVFMRVNCTRATAGLPVLSVPATPRSMPDPGAITQDYPELYQFNPSFATATYFMGAPGDIVPISSAGYWDSSPVLNGQYFQFRINVDQFTNGEGVLPENLDICKAMTGGGVGISVTLISLGTGGFTVRLVQAVTGGTWTLNANFAIEYLVGDVTLGFYLDDTTGMDSEIYLNGVLATSTPSSNGTPVIGNITADLVFGVIGGTGFSTFLLSDFRYFDTRPSDDDILLMYQGYILGTETAIVGFEAQSGLTFPNTTVNGTDYDFTIDSGAANYRLLTPHAALLIPQITLSVENTGLEGVNLNVYATPPISTGRSGNQSSYKLIGSYPWDDTTSWNLAADLGRIYGNIPGNSQILFKVDIFDTTTGVISGPSIRPPKKKPRFKAGAESGGGVS